MNRRHVSRLTSHGAATLVLILLAGGFPQARQAPADGGPALPAVTPATAPAGGDGAGAPQLAAATVPGSPGTSPAPPAVAAPATRVAMTPARLHMPDGQLKSHRLQVYVTAAILPGQNPRLRLFRSHALTEELDGEGQMLVPTFVASGQQWTETIDGVEVAQTGTILLFDGRDLPFGARAMVRVRPALTWIDGGVERSVLGPTEVNVGNIVAAVIWTVAVVGVAVLVVLVLSWRKDSNPVLLLTGVDGHLSLAQAQVACWTVFVGSVVLGYGLIRLEIPEIPESLVVLMGASLVTGGVAYFHDARKEDVASALGMTTTYRAWSWGDLVRVFTPGALPELSLAKAQMLFWTILLLVLFVSKSILEGRIWEVPWALVALMGFSQAGYLAPKLAATATAVTRSPTILPRSPQP